MKASGKRPTRKQKEILSTNNLNPADWLIVKNQHHVLQVVHREKGTLKSINM